MKISVDFETASIADLRKVGAWRYAGHWTTRILCMAYAVNDDEPETWFPGTPLPERFLQAVEDGAELHAWNAAFERAIWLHLGPGNGFPHVEPSRFHCTMARGLYWGLPPKLEQAAAVANVAQQKDKEGHRLMMQVTKPRNMTAIKRDPNLKPIWWTDEDPVKLIRLGVYCAMDVMAERAVGATLPAMPATERAVWLLDQRMNERGLRVDLDLAARLSAITEQEMTRISRQMSRLTNGTVFKTTQAARMLIELQMTGAPAYSLNKAALPELLKSDELTDQHRALLSLWQQGAKTSTSKLKAMEHTINADGRIRGLVQYGGAFRTLRWAGRGPQIQNFPRPMRGLDCSWAVHDMLAGIGADALGIAYGNPLDVVSSCLRSCFIPDKGHVLCVLDYSGIEARVVAWLADHKVLLEVFKRDEDIYIYTAGQLGSDNRQFGKVLVLACGYGMGPPKFMDTAAGYGIILTEEEAAEAVYGWRDKNEPIRNMWYAYDRAARETIKAGNPSPTHVGNVSFRMAKRNGKLDGALLMELPSGRPIVYRNAHLARIRVAKPVRDAEGNPAFHENGEPQVYFETEERIAYEGLNLAKKWVKITTWGGKLVENATQAIARDLLADALLRCDAKGIPLNTTIHDEIIAEPTIDDGPSTFKEMQLIMRNPPAWGRGLPLNAEGKLMQRYGKG